MGAIADIAEATLEPLVVKAAQAVAVDVRRTLDSRQDLSDPEKIGSALQPTTPLKPATVRGKRRRGSKTPTLPRVDTGRMRNSVRAVNVSRFHAEVGWFGSDREEVAIYQHFGTTGVPSRPFFGVSSKALSAIERDTKKAENEINRTFASLKLPSVSVTIKL